MDEQLAKMIARDFQPFSIVEDQGFRDYTKALDPTYILPSRKTISRTVLPRMYKKLKEELKTKVGSASAVCLTTDCWTSITTESYMAVTCHFIGNDYTLSTALLDCFSFSERHTVDNLAEQLKKISEDWSISEKVVACVSDNASNIKAAIKNVGWKHLPCFAHTLNLVVKEGLKAIQPVVDKVKHTVEYFHRSTVANEKLKATQQQMGLAELRLKQDVVTRWNILYGGKICQSEGCHHCHTCPHQPHSADNDA